MKLRFLSRAGHLVPLHLASGQIPRYVGREFVPPEEGKHAGAIRASDKPIEVDLQAKPVFAGRLTKACRRGELLPADEATARECGVPYVEPERLPSGEWQIKGFVEGWDDWPRRTPAKLAADLQAQRQHPRAGVKAQHYEAAKRGGAAPAEEVSHAS